MRYLIVDPNTKSVRSCEAEHIHDAEQQAGLDVNHVDHGTVVRYRDGGIGIVVYEFGLLEPPEQQKFFSLAGQLFAGPAVLYAFDETGETCPMPKLPNPPLWFDTVEDIELAIAANVVKRPATSVNGAVLWQWPQRIA